MVLEEVNSAASKPSSRPYHLMLLSANSSQALEHIKKDLKDYLRHNQNILIEDVAFTLQQDQSNGSHKRSFVVIDREDCLETLERAQPGIPGSSSLPEKSRPVVFLFPGQGSQYVNMGRDLYKNEPIFRREVDICAHIVEPIIGFDVRAILYPEAEGYDESLIRIKEITVSEIGIFIMSYALAKYWMALGVKPACMIGHGIGELVAATISGVFTLEDALLLVAKRSMLIQELPGGSMMAVRMEAEQLAKRIDKALNIGAINSSDFCVVSGQTDLVETLQLQLELDDIACRPMNSTHALHSKMMTPAIKPVEEILESINLKPHNTPIISTVLGRLLKPEDSTNPTYWSKHFCQTVQFDASISLLLRDKDYVFLEIGPGQMLSALIRQHKDYSKNHDIFVSSPNAKRTKPNYMMILRTLGLLWEKGIHIDWKHMYQYEKRKRVYLNTDKKTLRLDPQKKSTAQRHQTEALKAAVKSEAINGFTLDPNTLVQPHSASLNVEVRTLIESQLNLMTQQLKAWNYILANQGHGKSEKE